MPSRWEETTWGEAVELKYGKAIRGYQNAEEAYPVFGTNGQVGTHAQYLSEGPGVILGRKGAYRGVHYSNQPFFVIDTAYYVAPKQDLDMRWLYYAMRHYKLGQIDDGSPIPSTTRAAVYSSEFMRPPIVEQQSIATCLGSLDDKIELNRRMNETLEEIARVLFRDWFVDFGPTRRQAEGATDPAAIMGHAFPAGDMPAEVGTGSAPENSHDISTTKPLNAATLAPLFPAKLGDDGLPEGWVEQPFEAFVEIVGGGTPKTKIAEYWGGDIPWFSVVDAPNQGAVYVHATEKSITQAGLENSSARMVPEGTTIISARGTVGKIGMAPRDMTFNQSCYALRPKKPVGERFVFLATGQLVERLQAMAHGSVFSTITRNTFSSLSFAGADELCYSAFEDVTAPLFAKIKVNGQENQTLAEMRDLLLPKLMSGEIRLNEVEAAV